MPAEKGQRHMERWPGSSSLVVPVPALEEWVRARHEHYDPAYVSSDPTFAHAHLTLLSPFVAPAGLTPAVARRVAQVLAGHPPFVVRLGRVEVFPDGIIHLPPEPDGPLRQLTADLARAFPDHPPYAGRYADVRPHLTLDLLADGVDVAGTRRSLGDLVPVVARVEEARLSWYEQDRCRTLATWPLGVWHRSGIEKPPAATRS
jgi:2'-5' RNA ligase